MARSNHPVLVFPFSEYHAQCDWVRCSIWARSIRNRWICCPSHNRWAGTQICWWKQRESKQINYHGYIISNRKRHIKITCRAGTCYFFCLPLVLDWICNKPIYSNYLEIMSFLNLVIKNYAFIFKNLIHILFTLITKLTQIMSFILILELIL